MQESGQSRMLVVIAVPAGLPIGLSLGTLGGSGTAAQLLQLPGHGSVPAPRSRSPIAALPAGTARTLLSLFSQ